MTVINPPISGKDGDGNELEPVYEDGHAFYREYLRFQFARDLQGEVRWCVLWTEHPEAVAGVDALWRSWEDCTFDPGRGLAVWLVQFAYPIMSHLFDEHGTFDGCSELAHRPRAEPLP